MTQGILNRVEKSLHGQFRPSSPEEYLALRLARGLGEADAAAHYAVLLSQHPTSKLVAAYYAALAEKDSGKRGATFHQHLLKNQSGVTEPTQDRIVAIKIDRRAIAVAVFFGTHLEGRRVLQLSSEANRAEISTITFLREFISEHKCPAAVVEVVDGDVQRSIFYSATLQQLRTHGISVWGVSKQVLLESLSQPPLKTRNEMRSLMLRIWPMPSLKKSQLCALDAFALGLYIQTERLLEAG